MASSAATAVFTYFMENSLRTHEIEFRQCCHNNDVLGAMDIFNTHRGMDTSFNNEECFRIVAENGNIVFIQWLYNTHHVNPMRLDELVIAVCEKGHLIILQWMNAVGLLEDVPMKSAYFRAVRKHDIAMADWIMDTFHNFNKR